MSAPTTRPPEQSATPTNGTATAAKHNSATAQAQADRQPNTVAPHQLTGAQAVIRSLEVERPKGDRPVETLTLGFSKMKWYPAVPGSPLPVRDESGERARR